MFYRAMQKKNCHIRSNRPDLEERTNQPAIFFIQTYTIQNKNMLDHSVCAYIISARGEKWLSIAEHCRDAKILFASFFFATVLFSSVFVIRVCLRSIRTTKNDKNARTIQFHCHNSCTDRRARPTDID